MVRETLLALFLSLQLLGCEEKPEPTLAAKNQASSQPSSATAASSATAPPSALEYVGREQCLDCHAEQAKRYQGSDHDKALMLPGEEGITAPFAGETLRGKNISATFEGGKANARIVIASSGDQSSGGGGEAGTHEILWSMGHDPLQQYLFKTKQGRIQAFSGAYATGPGTKEIPNQSWYFLTDADVPQDDVLHYLGEAYNYNFMCSECHSTHVEKNFDLESNTYRTDFAEIDVSCEACHGPGSEHVALKRAGSTSNGRLRAVPVKRNWVRSGGARIAHLVPSQTAKVDNKLGSRSLGSELDTCAPCHSRRADLGPAHSKEIYEEFYSDRYRLSTLRPDLYFDDGQIKEEVYELGSFLQSKMARAGVVCSDCHDPHTAELRQPPQETCGTCHQSEYYDSKQHHFHNLAPAALGKSDDRDGQPLCVDCHAPERTYMGVDARRDHRFSVPRPDLSAQFGFPNPCSSCHKYSDKQAAKFIETAHGTKRSPHFGENFARVSSEPQSGPRLLAEVFADKSQSAIVRASALERWGTLPDPGNDILAALEVAVQEQAPLIRLTAADLIGQLPLHLRVNLLQTLWDDPTRAVRISAAMSAIGLPKNLMDSLPSLKNALNEAASARRYDSDRVEGLLALASLAEARHQGKDAEKFYRLALERFPTSPEAPANYADALRRNNRDTEGGQVLSAALSRIPENGDLTHAYGLWLVRNDRKSEALPIFRRAFELAQGGRRQHYAFVYLLSLMSQAPQFKWENEKQKLLLELGSSLNHPELKALKYAP